MTINIREFVPADFDQLLPLQIDLIDKMSEIDPHKRFRSRTDLNARKYFDALLKDLSMHGGKIFVAETDGKLVGYISGKIEEESAIDREAKYSAKQGYIEGLFVDETQRGKGLSSRLIEQMENYFRSKGCALSSVACVAVNDAARKLYAKAGYAEQYIDFLKKL